MRKFAINLFCFFIPLKKLRKKTRNFLLNCGYSYYKNNFYEFTSNDKKFPKYIIRKNSVLIVEPNSYHAEILPGCVKYFQDLGFNVDLFLRHQNIDDSPFLNIQNVNIFAGTGKHLLSLLKLNKIKKYDFVFFSSSAYWEAKIHFDSYLNFLGFIPQSKYGLLMIEHNIFPCLKEYDEEKYLKEGRLFTLSGFDNTPMLNPHYFGEFKRQNKNNKVNFIVVGTINKKCKSHELLLNSANDLLKNGYDNFIITIIGRGVFKAPQKLKKYIDFKGSLSFKNMYKVMQSSDFFLPLLDETIKEQQRYLSGTTSGSCQLILGFLKPCLINEKFGNAYGFNNDNSIIYQNNDLANAMQKAIDLSQNKYETMQNNLQKLANDVYKKSLNNLKTAVVRIKNEK